MTDHLIVATAANDTIRIYAALTTGLVEDARKIHDTWPTATAALGRALTGAVMLGLMSDNPYRLTIQFSGDGPLGRILAVSNQPGKVKGYVDHPHVDLNLNSQGKLDVGGAVGSGNLTVIKDYGLKNPYNGIVPIQNGEIATDLAYYFTKSEQTPSAVSLGVLVNPGGEVRVSGGLIVQVMPGASDRTIKLLEEEITQLPSVTTLLNSGRLPIQVVKELEIGNEPKILSEVALCYECDCSWERFRGPLLNLGNEELSEILKEQGQIEVRCHFCNKLYHYDRDLVQ